MTLKDIIKFTRCHTAALTIPITVIGLFVAGVPALSWQTAAFALFALAWHALGFAGNNLQDYQYDKDDSSKQNHPLVQGRINFRKANAAVNFGIMWLFIAGVMLSNMRPLSLVFLGLCIISGYTYNCASKDTIWSWIPITLCFSSLPLFAYFAYADSISTTMQWVYLYVIVQLIFQIAVEGAMKELPQENETNWMRALGYKTKWKMYTWRGVAFGTGLLFLKYIIAAQLSANEDTAPVVYLVWLFAGIATVDLLMPYEWDRKRVVRDSAIIEILSYILLIVALQGVLGTGLTLALIFLPIIWFIIFNRWFFGSTISPKV